MEFNLEKGDGEADGGVCRRGGLELGEVVFGSGEVITDRF